MMKILIAGASGLVGSALASLLRHRMHQVFTLVRRAPEDLNEIYWDPSKQTLSSDSIEGFDAIVNLSGESISNGRWTKKKKQRILDSRIQSTSLLVKTIAQLAKKPKVLINASAIGIYGDSGDAWVNEKSSPGTGFLADVCQQWEKAADPVESMGVRLVKLRTGVVLTDSGGALKKMLLPFKLCLGGVIGSGKQYMSWIMLQDLISIIAEAIIDDHYSGVINAVTDNPVTNREFTKALGVALHRPTVFPMPAFVAKLAFGEVADALLLSSCRVKPQKLMDCGYQFLFPRLQETLNYLVQT